MSTVNLRHHADRLALGPLLHARPDRQPAADVPPAGGDRSLEQTTQVINPLGQPAVMPITEPARTYFLLVNQRGFPQFGLDVWESR